MIYYGIDISKDVLDVIDSLGNYYQFSNDYKGFKLFSTILNKQGHCVMESTGYYHYRLAYFLLDQGIKVSIENPICVKRFIQMKLSKIKTDKSDAQMICEYAQSVDLQLWKGQSKNQIASLQLLRLLSSYQKQQTMLKNKLHAEGALGTPCKLVVRSLKRSLKMIQSEIKTIEMELTALVKKEHQELLTLLESIPGLGRKTSTMLIVLTDGFKRFSTASELCSFSGLTPVIKQSGSSVRGRSRISKVGNKKLRNLLFMCSFTACKCNKACKAIYDRIVAKGKSKKLALIAVCNKLLKQAFAIAKSKVKYNQNHRSTRLIT